MSTKPPYVIKKIDTENPKEVEANFQDLFATRLESRWKRNGSAVQGFIYQGMETGEVDFSANGSQAVVQSFGFREKQNTVIFAIAHAKSSLISAHITDITNTGLTILCRPVQHFVSAITNGTATETTFSNITTATVKVYYAVIGSNP